jgi:protein-tyrosine phosphatase
MRTLEYTITNTDIHFSSVGSCRTSASCEAWSMLKYQCKCTSRVTEHYNKSRDMVFMFRHRLLKNHHRTLSMMN